ncbi:MAG: NAD(P)/FAD-dependent oxidoreductase, partial [Ureaplasma sp.]|nr:NAD(P)/FAD-dependent oxidoreductase [Ureaplasma sp.]
MNNLYDVIIIGAGVSGVFCALNLNDKLKVLMIDANEEILKKFKVSGNGNANMTNMSNIDSLLNNIIYGTKKFMYYGFSQYGPDKIIDFLKKHKMKFYQREISTWFYLAESIP